MDEAMHCTSQYNHDFPTGQHMHYVVHSIRTLSAIASLNPLTPLKTSLENFPTQPFQQSHNLQNGCLK